MLKLYDTSPYTKEFTTEITAIHEKTGAYHIVLEETAFYPGSLEMPCDLGTIEDSPITEVYEEDHTIYHVSPKKPIKIHKAKCAINWPHRFQNMQQRTARHLLSAYLLEDLHLETISYKYHRDAVTLTLDASLLPVQIAELEKQMNQFITEGLATRHFIPTKQELKKLGIKKAPAKGADALRFIQVGDFEPVLSNDLILQSALELQLFKITDAQKLKTGTNLTFLVGASAVNYLLSRENTSTDTLEEVTKECRRLTSEVQTLKSTIDYYKAKECVEAAPLVAGYHIVKAIYEDLEPKALQSLANKMVQHPHVIVLLGLKVEKTAYLFFMCSKDQYQISMNKLLKDSITLIDGQGGGTDFSAQGGGKSASNLESALDYALSQIKNKL